jgi:hypothetical protein
MDSGFAAARRPGMTTVHVIGFIETAFLASVAMQEPARAEIISTALADFYPTKRRRIMLI